MQVEIATAADIREMADQLACLRKEIAALTRAVAVKEKESAPEWLTVQEAAEYLRVTDVTIRRHVKGGLYDTKRQGKAILISRESILD